MSDNAVIDRQEWYSDIYESTHPKPLQVRLSFWKELGADAIGLVLSTVGSIILSAVRTSTVFMLIEMLLLSAFDKNNLLASGITSSFPIIAMSSSLVAFEGLLFSHGFSKGKRSGRTDANIVAVGFSFAITIVAGFVASFGLLNLAQTNVLYLVVLWLLAVLTAIGAPVVVYYGSMNLGALANYWKKLVTQNESSFVAERKQWESNMLSSMNGVRGRTILEEYHGTSSKNERPQRTPTTNKKTTSKAKRTSRQKKVRKSSNEQRTHIAELFSEVYKSERRVAGVTEVAKIIAAEELGSRANEQTVHDLMLRKKGYVSTVRKEWMENSR